MERAFTIHNTSGLHARPATNLVKKANSYPCEIKIVKGDDEVDAKNLISILGLGLKQGEKITVITRGEKEEEALEAIAEIIKAIE